MAKLASAITVDAAFLATHQATFPVLRVGQLLCSLCVKYIRFATSSRADTSAARVESDARPPPSATQPPPPPVRQSSAAAVAATVSTVPEGALFLFARLSLFERLALFFFFFFFSSDILDCVCFASGKTEISHFLFSCVPLDAFTCCLLFFLPLFPLFVCSRQYLACSPSTSNARRIHPYPARTFKLFRHRCGRSDLCQGHRYSYTMTTPLPSHRSAGTDAARAGPGSPTHPHRSEVVAKAYENAKAATLRELSESSTRSDHVFNELMTTTDLDTFVLACRNWHLLAWSDDVFKLRNRAHRPDICREVEAASAG